MTVCNRRPGDWVAGVLAVSLMSLTTVAAPAQARPDRVAADAMNYRFTVCGTPIQFPDRHIRWDANPTYNGYREWPWQFARHWFLRNLATYYRASGDERAARTWVEIVSSFIADAPPPPPQAKPNATWSWRTLDTGLRASVWASTFPLIEKSPAVTPEFRRRFFASVSAHARRLIPSRTDNNWRLMELHGLLDLAFAFPRLGGAAAWRQLAEKELSDQLARQIYPDGFQFELTTGYHGIVHRTYHPLCLRYRQLGIPIPAGFTNNLEKAYGLYLKLMRPDGRLPALNDAGYPAVRPILGAAADLFPDRKDFRWGASAGAAGSAPDFLSLALPYSGTVVFRNSWSPDAVWGCVDMSPYGRSHQHEDKLSFVLFAYGKNMIVEGGSFAYDRSPMRRYVLSTRSHNTIRIDGCDQAAKATWRWREEMLHQKAALAFSTSAACDTASASFDLGYGSARELDRSVTHTRRVEFVKDDPAGPWFRITDDLKASDAREHAFEQLWHLETCGFRMGADAFTADFGDGVTLDARFTGPGARLVDKIGQCEPEYQGWLPRSSQAARVHRPVHTPTWVGTFRGSIRLTAEFRPRRVAAAGASTPKVCRNAEGRGR